MILTSIIVGTLAVLVYLILITGSREKNLPPGPPTVPILGNIPAIPRKGAHFQFTKWARQYGGIYSLKLGTGTAAVITDRRLVKELIDKRSSKYAERPKSYVANLISGGDHILLMQYGQQWRDTRKLLHGAFMEKVVEEHYLRIQEAEARQMLRDYLLEPENHMLHPKRYSNSITMSIIWGVRTPTAQTRHFTRLYSLMEVWSKVMEPGATPPVDVYPFLHYLPQSIFHNWVDRATHVQKEMNGLYSRFLSDIRARRAKVGSRGSFMDKVLDQADSEKRTLTEGGSDTSASIILAFVQAMVAYPEVQKKAQAQIDSVVGSDRSPTWSDYASLPYVAQCVKEAFRWRTVVPLAFPHALAEDDWVDGMFLPKGTVIIVNAWGMQHDPNRFKNPQAFNPEHFAGCTTLATELANGPWEKRDHYGYGTGRRFCPGAHLAERNLFLAMAKLLWAFEMLPGKDADGNTVQPDTDPVTGYCEGFLVCVNDFKANFKVRGEDRKETIMREFGEVEGLFEKFNATGEEKA